jgi:hypothetical protein
MSNRRNFLDCVSTADEAVHDTNGTTDTDLLKSEDHVNGDTPKIENEESPVDMEKMKPTTDVGRLEEELLENETSSCSLPNMCDMSELSPTAVSIREDRQNHASGVLINIRSSVIPLPPAIIDLPPAKTPVKSTTVDVNGIPLPSNKQFVAYIRKQSRVSLSPLSEVVVKNCNDTCKQKARRNDEYVSDDDSVFPLPKSPRMEPKEMFVTPDTVPAIPKAPPLTSKMALVMQSFQ